MEEIKISVIVPVYNTEKYLAECLDSICNQTLKEIEILLVNDESTDGSLAILENYAKKDNRIQIIQNIHEGDGAASARNHGLKLAKGKYLSFLDSDDYFDLTMLEKVYTRAELLQTCIVVYNGYQFHDDTKTSYFDAIHDMDQLTQKEVYSCNDFPETFFYYATNYAWLCLFNRKFILQENLTFQAVYCLDDALFVRSAFALAKRISAIPEHLAYHRRDHAESQTTNSENFPLSILSSSLAIKELLEEKMVFTKIRNGFAAYVIGCIKVLFSRYRHYENFSILFDALRNEYIDKLTLEESLTENILDFDAYEWIHKIKTTPKVEYIFDMIQENQKQAFCFESIYIFPHKQVNPEDKVIIYGAGHIGTSFFVQNMKNNHCQLVAWVDKNMSDKQYPVEGLDILRTRQCDKIIIAIDNDTIVEQVHTYLIEIGFKKDQIIYGLK